MCQLQYVHLFGRARRGEKKINNKKHKFRSVELTD